MNTTQQMSKTYADIQKQIEALSKEAEKLRKKEIEGVIERIKEAISTYGLTAADLGLQTRKSPARTRGAQRRGGGAGKDVKYRDGNGNTWGGRGPRPAWLRDALAAGRDLQDFAV